MFAGVPVVSTNVGGTGEAILDQQTGLLVPHDDAASLAQAMERLLKDTAFSRKLSDNAKKRVESLFSLEQMVLNTKSLYSETPLAC